MGFADKHLLEGERIVFRTNQHWLVFFPPVLLMTAGALVAASAGELSARLLLSPVGAPYTMVSLLLLAATWISRKCSEFVVTDKRVLMKTGFISRRSDELLLSRVEGIDVRQGILGRILDCGSVTVGGTGGSREPFKHIAQPLDFRRHVQEQIEAQKTPATVS